MTLTNLQAPENSYSQYRFIKFEGSTMLELLKEINDVHKDQVNLTIRGDDGFTSVASVKVREYYGREISIGKLRKCLKELFEKEALAYLPEAI